MLLRQFGLTCFLEEDSDDQMNHQRLSLLPVEAVAIAIGLVMLLVALNALFKIRDIRLLYLCLGAVMVGTTLVLAGVTRIILGLK